MPSLRLISSPTGQLGEVLFRIFDFHSALALLRKVEPGALRFIATERRLRTGESRGLVLRSAAARDVPRLLWGSRRGGLAGGLA
jgi:hypothetical protein